MKYKLNIPKPCHEDWSKMSPSEKGKFCQACKKEVVDFTAMTDHQTIQTMNEREGENVCGRFRKKQLNKELSTQKTSHIPKVAAAVAFATFLAASEASFAQGEVVKVISREQIENLNLLQIDEEKVKGEIKTIKGKVIDQQSKKPIPYANVIVKGTQNGVQTDVEGNFSLTYFKTNPKRDTLVVYSLGFRYKEIPATTKKPILLALKEERLIMGDVKVIEPKEEKNRIKENTKSRGKKDGKEE